MELEFDRKDKDSRGGFILATYGGKKISLFEIKKGQARGGYVWEKPIQQTLISGRVEYMTTNVDTNKEKIQTLEPPAGVVLNPGTSDLIIALDDSIMVEIHENTKNGELYPRYRNLVENHMKP